MTEALRCSELLLRMKPGDPLETRDRGFIYEQLDCPVSPPTILNTLLNNARTILWPTC